jgi:hypothetical protein
MAERRSLSTALSSPVPGVDANLVRSFVTQNQAAERPVAEIPVPVGPPRTTSVESTPVPDFIAAKSARQKPKKPNRFQPVGLIPVTVRLRPEIAGALKRASLERELAGEEMFTQQAIVEEALEPWLASEGFLD